MSIARRFQPLSTITFATAAVFAVGVLLASAPAHADKAGAHFRSGMALKAKGKVDAAIAEFEKAVAARDTHVMAWASLKLITRRNLPPEPEAWSEVVGE